MKEPFTLLLKYAPLFLVPFITWKGLIDTAQVPQSIFVNAYLFFLVILMIVDFYRNKQLNINWNPGLSYLLLFVGIGGIQVLFTPLIEEAIYAWLKPTAFFVLVFLLIQEKSSTGQVLKSISKVLCLQTTVLLLIIGWQLTQLNLLEFDHQSSYELKATLGHRNLLSQYVLLLLPFNFFLRNDSIGWLRWLSRLQVFLSLLLIFILFSRAVWVALLGASVTLIIVSVLTHSSGRFQINFKLSNAGAVLIAACVILAVVAGHNNIREVLFKQSVTSVNTRYGTAKDRLILWDKTWDMFREHPGKGIGPGQWKIQFLKSGVDGTLGVDSKTFYQRPHNDFLWILSEYGFFTFFFYVLFWLILLKQVWTKMKSSEADERSIGQLSIFFLVSFGCISMFSFPMERIPHLVLFALVCSLVLDQKSFNTNRPGGLLAVFGLLIYLSLGTIFHLSRLRAESSLKIALSNKASGNWDIMLRHVQRATNPCYRIDPTSTPVTWYEGLAHYMLGEKDHAFESFKTAFEINPYHVHVLNNLATSYNEIDSSEISTALYREALRINPQFTDALYNLSILLINEGEFTQVDSNLRHLVNTQVYESRMDNLLFILTDYTIREFAQGNSEPIEIEVMSRMLNDKNWMKDLYFKSVENNISYEQQLELDIAYIIKNDNLKL